MKRAVILMILVLMILPSLNADMIPTGEKQIQVNNIITNINDFSDYVFVSYGNINLGMCPIKVINSDGKISTDYYKGCSVSVYAIPKSKYNETLISSFDAKEYPSSDEESQALINLLLRLDAKKVISDIRVYMTVSESSSIKETTNYYTIDLTQVKTEPDKTINEKDNMRLLIYISLSLISLVIIILLLWRRKKK